MRCGAVAQLLTVSVTVKTSNFIWGSGLFSFPPSGNKNKRVIWLLLLLYTNILRPVNLNNWDHRGTASHVCLWKWKLWVWLLYGINYIYSFPRSGNETKAVPSCMKVFILASSCIPHTPLPCVKTLRSSFSKFWWHCVLSGRTQRRAFEAKPRERRNQ